MEQRTLSREYSFEGKGLHTGRFAHMTVCPAPEDTGIRFIRTDVAQDAVIDAVSDNVSTTTRSTTLENGGVKVHTVEHILSALTGLGIDNALIRIDSDEVPILDGSARLYVEAMGADPLTVQSAPRRWVELKEEIRIEDPKSGSYVLVTPSEDPETEVTIDFDSRVLGVQTVRWNNEVDYAEEIAPCRTFCFFHEIMKLLRLGLVKGGSVQNAIVIVEKPVRRFQLRFAARKFRQPLLEVTPQGYLSNLELRFPDECGRHKLLDIIGDLRLCGGFLKAKVTAYKPGHGINTRAAAAIREKTK